MPFLSIFFHFVLFFPFCPLSFPMNYSFLMYFFAQFRLSPPSSFFVSPSPPSGGRGLSLPLLGGRGGLPFFVHCVQIEFGHGSARLSARWTVIEPFGVGYNSK